tara:strand:- start:1422 stop:1901 length:480 start_codon:yes stop_codon:yes gene_type:complete
VSASSITLSWAEVIYAATAGVFRRIDSIRSGLNKHKHAAKSDWATDIDGACAELAFAKFVGAYWSGHIRSFKAPDVGDVHVRSTNWPTGCLIVRHNDDENCGYVLVISECPRFRIAGYITGADAKSFPIRKGTDGQADAWFIPQEKLRDVGSLFSQEAA